MDNERRHNPRQPSIDLLDYFVIDKQGEKGEYSLGRTLNISNGGILLETPKRLQIEDRIMITLDLEEELVEITGVIVHAAVSAGRYRAGIKFLHLDERTSRFITNFIKAFHKEHPHSRPEMEF
jgi:c-di-GMP-binding flagellar brake protein YcgR